MKKYIIFYVILILLSTKGTAAEVKTDELIDLAALTTGDLAPIDEWTVTLKETKDKSSLKKLLSQIRKNDYEVVVTETNKARYYQWTNDTHTSNISTEFKIIVPNKDGYKSELVAVISGSSWDSAVKNVYLQTKTHVTGKYFSSNFKEFTCLTTRERDILNNGYIKDVFKDKLDMTYINNQKDSASNKHKKIIYGYTDLWPNEIRSMDEPMNFQMVFHQGPNDGVQLTLGTPILINEY